MVEDFLEFGGGFTSLLGGAVGFGGPFLPSGGRNMAFQRLMFSSAPPPPPGPKKKMTSLPISSAVL